MERENTAYVMRISENSLAEELKNFAQNVLVDFRNNHPIRKLISSIRELHSLGNFVRWKYQLYCDEFTGGEWNPDEKDLDYLRLLWSTLEDDLMYCFNKAFGIPFRLTNLQGGLWLNSIQTATVSADFLHIVADDRLLNHPKTRIQEWMDLVDLFKHTLEFDLRFLVTRAPREHGI